MLKNASAAFSLCGWLCVCGSVAACSSGESKKPASSAGSAGSSGNAGSPSAVGSLGGGPLSNGGAGDPAGVAGSGDTPATAGASGATQVGAPAGACPANATFCADFEDGTIPSTALFFPAYQRSMVATYMAVDATVAHGGTHSLKVTPGSNFSQMLAVKTGTATFWSRVYLRQDIDTHTVMAHDTFLTATDADGDPNQGVQIRIGEHSCQLEINRASDDKEVLSDAVNGVSTYACAGGVTFAPNTWYCLEAFYDGPNRSVRVFVNGTEISALHVSDWGPYTYDVWKFGFENYGGAGRTLWYDDIAVAPQQVGCNSPAGNANFRRSHKAASENHGNGNLMGMAG